MNNQSHVMTPHVFYQDGSSKWFCKHPFCSQIDEHAEEEVHTLHQDEKHEEQHPKKGVSRHGI